MCATLHAVAVEHHTGAIAIRLDGDRRARERPLGLPIGGKRARLSLFT